MIWVRFSNVINTSQQEHGYLWSIFKPDKRASERENTRRRAQTSAQTKLNHPMIQICANILWVFPWLTLHPSTKFHENWAGSFA